MGRYVVAIRHEDDKDWGEVHRAKNILDLLGRLRKLYAARNARPIKSALRAPKAEAYIIENYGHVPTSAMAKHLSAQLGKPITKNMIVGRAWRIGVAQKRLTGNGCHEHA